MKKKSLIILPIFAIAVGVALYFSQLGNSKTSYPLLKYNFPPGTTLSYKIDYSSKGKGELLTGVDKSLATTSQIHQADMHLKGDLLLENLSLYNNKDYLVEFLFTPQIMDFTYNNNKFEKPSAILVSVVMEPNGFIRTFHMDPKYFNLYGNVIREFLTVFEFVVPDAAVSKWSVNEKNIFNDQLVNYKIASVDSKSKTYYTIDKKYTNNVPETLTTGGFLIEFDVKKGLVNTLKGTKKQEFKFSNSSVSVSESSLNIKLVGVGQAIRSVDYIENVKNKIVAKVKENLNGEQIIASMEKNTYQKVLDKDNLATLTVELTGIKKDDHMSLTKFVQRLTALLFVHPDQADEVAELLKEYEWEDGRWGAIAASLTFVGSKETQTALISALDYMPADSRSQITLMPHLAFVEKPIIEAENYFRTLKENTKSEEVAYKSNNALGIMAKNLRDEDKARSLSILNELSAELDNEQDHTKKVRLIEAIGNAGLREQTDLLREYVESTDVSVKVPAIFSLRHINSDESREMLLGYLEDEDEKIRESAVMALVYTKANDASLTKYGERLKSEHNIAILKVIIQNLAKMSNEFPESLSLIDDFIKTCANKDICGFARNIRSMSS